MFVEKDGLEKHLNRMSHSINRFIISVGLIAIAVPSLGPIIALVGALGSSTLALILPPILNILTFGLDDMGGFYWKLWKNMAISYFGMLSCIFGTYQSVLLLIELYY